MNAGLVRHSTFIPVDSGLEEIKTDKTTIVSALAHIDPFLVSRKKCSL